MIFIEGYAANAIAERLEKSASKRSLAGNRDRADVWEASLGRSMDWRRSDANSLQRIGFGEG